LYAAGVTSESAVLESLSPHHIVQFYEDDAYLRRVVSTYLSRGLKAGQPVIVIATPAHCEGFLTGLAAHGHDAGLHQRGGGLTLVDAGAALERFMVGSMPDPDLFDKYFGQLVKTVRRKWKDCTIRAYGEMKDILWKHGNAEGALRLEELWNELAARYPISLLCGYSMANFAGESHGAQFEQMCARHVHVLPTERYMEVDTLALRLREVCRLQQRAATLESEIAKRKGEQSR
jgi:hypothetical protein